MREIAKLLKTKNLDQATLSEIKHFFKMNVEIYNKFNSFWKKLDPHYSKNIQYKVIHTIAAYPEFTKIEDLISHINLFLIDSEGEVSPSKFIILKKINPEFNNIIINSTHNFPKKITLTGRCELLRKGIFELPKCVNCNNHVSWKNSSELLTYCSKECGDNSKFTKEKRAVTMNALYGSNSYTQTKEFQVKAKKTKKVKYGNEDYTNREKAISTWINIYGVDNPLKDANVKKKSKTTMKKKYGVENYVEHPDFKNKAEKSYIKNFGVKHPFLNEEIKNKAKKTIKNKYGVENYVEHPDFKEKSKKTCIKHFGYRHPSQSPEIYKKIQSSLFTVKQYKNTKLNYQGSYELCFLELMEEKGLLNEIKTPEPISYQLNKKEFIYNPDFEFHGKIIEIKSSWTYNRNGKDKLLEEKNHTKWNAAKNSGKKIVILKNKSEIKKFVDLL